MNYIAWREFAENYFHYINTELSGLNLTALKTVDDIYTKQVLDSIEPVFQLTVFEQVLLQAAYVVDLGTGGGFPLLPIAKQFPETKCVGIDARNKKLLAVKKIAHFLNLKNVSVIHATFEEIVFDQKKTVFLIKAVGKIYEILEKLNIKFPSHIFFYKGANFYQLEIEELGKLNNNYQLVGVYEINITGIEKRYLVHFETHDNVPRGTQASRQLKAFSECL